MFVAANVINGTRMAAQVRDEVASGVAEMIDKHEVAPGLGVVLVGDDAASAVYVRNKERAARESGMSSRSVTLPADSETADVLAVVHLLNDDDDIHGILVQLPMPAQIDESRVLRSVDPRKDVDGLHPYNMGLLMRGSPRFVPATPAAVREILLRSGHSPSGKRVVVLGRSDIVGKPVANLLMQRGSDANATVTVCHTGTVDLYGVTAAADIIIAAVGRPRFLTADMVSEGVVVVDVGINTIAAPERKRGYRLVGDADFDGVSQKASAITPVPGGVGPMTIAMLLRNTLDAARFYNHPHLDPNRPGF